jgi:cyclic pyranopterin monophosphate synthase
MVDISHKSNSLRKAIALAVVRVSNETTMRAILEKKVPKGDVFEFSRAAGLLGIKKTSDLIPDCHPLPIEFAQIRYQTEGLDILIEVEVHTIYKTGVEVEAMHGASLVALTIYDMLKPLDNGIEINTIKLVSKKGGKADLKQLMGDTYRAAIVVCSDRISQGKGVDTAGAQAKSFLEKQNLQVLSLDIIPDDTTSIRQKVEAWKGAVDLLLFVGGTGLGTRDLTPETIKPFLDIDIPGIMETARRYGQDRNQKAMLSRGIAGMIGSTLVLTTPGSQAGCIETLQAVFPAILHVFQVRRGQIH